MENEKSFVTYLLKKIIIVTKNNLMDLVTDNKMNDTEGYFTAQNEVFFSEKFAFLQDAKDFMKTIVPNDNSLFIRDDDIPQIIIVTKYDDFTITEIIGVVEEK